VEKTKPEILPYLLNVKSPQQITGSLLKSLISKQLNIKQSEIYHLSIMPCFDKKLEGARADGEIIEEDSTTQEVDCVLTPKELIELLREENVNIYNYITKSNEPPLELYKRATPIAWPNPIESWFSNNGGSSGGYAFNYILSLQQHYQSIPTVLKEIKGKNSDVVEYQLINTATGEKIGSSAIINGFRNIQNLVRKLKPSGKVKIGSGLASRRKARMKGKSDKQEDENADPSSCDFVEVMACPGGCINGGGINQVSLSETTDLNSELTTDDNGKDHMNRLVKKYEEEFQELDLFESGRMEFLSQFVSEFIDTFNVEERLFKYKFSIIEKANDILSVGNTW
jgi:iron only hydrogenase large subunit-like protein